MNCKPIITYAGDPSLFQDLESALAQAIPKEPTEWRRPFGRVIKSFYVDASFVPFSVDIVPKSGEWKLLDQPVLHTYWTECTDLDAYKSNIKEDIEQWMKSLNGADWMIILVEVYDIRKSNKLLPRTTVLDKIRADFAGKQGDRVISLIHPIKSESKSAESWRGLVSRIRVLLLYAYNKTLTKVEELVRLNRECRQQPTWSFCSYFLMQEELALVLEMLSLYNEALVQYDELDALFTQFVLNSMKGDYPKWLHSFTVPLKQWAGPHLGQKIVQNHRDSIKYSRLDLLQFRSYLFGRQCALLLLLCKPWEIAQRTLPFLQNCVNELNILEVNYPEGAVSCWIFLVCLEVLHTCDKFNDSAQVEAYSLYTAGLWAYARDKLKELGELCGLTPGPGPTSEQLHTVVGLSSGMGDPDPNSSGPTPVDKLKEALSSKDAYNKYFLELSELAISTYKHIGRLRSAKLIGQDLATFYLSLDQPDKAATFLTNSLTGFQEENWPGTAADVQIQLVEAYAALSDNVKYLTTCASVAASSELDNATRVTYFHKFTDSLKQVPNEGVFISRIEDLMDITAVELEESYKISEGVCDVTVVLVINNRLPGPVLCSNVSLSIEIEKAGTETTNKRTSRRKPSKYEVRRLPVFELLNYKQDHTLHAANIVCQEPHKVLKRTDSHGVGRKLSPPVRNDFTASFTCQNITLQPGVNHVNLHWKANEVGVYSLGQVSVLLGCIELLGHIPHCSSFQIHQFPSSVELTKGPAELLAGLPHDMLLTIHAGSYKIKKESVLQVRCSRGLTCSTDLNDKDDALKRELEVPLPDAEPFTSIKLSMKIFTELPPQRDRETSLVHHMVTLKCTWCEGETSVPLSFQPPLKSLLRLHTALERKFVQITVSGLSAQILELKSPNLLVTNAKDMIAKSLNPSKGQPKIISNGLNVSLLWELDLKAFPSDSDFAKLDFSLEYSPIENKTTLETLNDFRLYKCHFDLQNYKTLFVVRCTLEPGKDADFCRIGAMCQLQLEVIKSVGEVVDISLMYEVLADQALWAVCGRAAGVILLDNNTKQNVTLDVMPLAQGFLPLPLVRLSKYIPAVEKESSGKETSHPRLEPFSPGQVYNASKSQQVHILPAAVVD